MPPEHWSDPSLEHGESVPLLAWLSHGTLSHTAEHGIYSLPWPSGPCSHMHRRNTQPVDDNHTASGHQLHAWVKLSHASQTPLVTVLLLE